MRLRLGEFHPFQAGGHDFLYLVPSAAVFSLDQTAASILAVLRDESQSREELARRLNGRFRGDDLAQTVDELLAVRALREEKTAPEPVFKILPPTPFPLATMVLNVTTQCNLSCTYLRVR